MFEPLHDAHAIEQLTCSLKFDRPLDDVVMQRVLGAANEMGDALPGRSNIVSIGFAIGQGGGLGSMIGEGASEGLIRTRVAPNGQVVKELRVEKTGIGFRTNEYTRWADVWAESRDYFSRLLRGVDTVAEVSNYSLQYVDKFIWRGVPTDALPQHLLRLDSAFLTPAVFRASDLWHSYCGMFDRAGADTKRLLTVNADCVDEQDPAGLAQRVVKFTTTAAEILNQSGFEPRRVPVADAMVLLDRQMPTLHSLLKNVFADLIQDQHCARVGIEGHT